jgi:hypothetical protein
MSPHPPTPTELRAAFQRAGLWRQGWTFARALAVPSIRVALTCAADAARREAARGTPRLPEQAPLFQEVR